MKNNFLRLVVISEFVVFALSACKTSPVDLISTKEEAITPIYITVVGHIEDVPAYVNCDKKNKKNTATNSLALQMPFLKPRLLSISRLNMSSS